MNSRPGSGADDALVHGAPAAPPEQPRKHQRPQRARKGAPIVLMMLPHVGTIGAPFSLVGAFDASLKIARSQRITRATPEPSLCAWEVLLMLLMRSS